MVAPSNWDMWDWFALLDACCDVNISSVGRPDGRGGYQTVWTVVVTPRDGSGPTVQGEAASMLEAMVVALEEAQERRWIK